MILVELSHASVAFTTRRGGISEPPFASLNLGLFTEDAAAAVRANLRIVREVLGLRELFLMRQVHGAQVLEARATGAAGAAPPPEGDAAVAADGGIGLLATGADCPPVALATPERVAIAHCGWKPLAAGLLERVAERLGEGPLEAAIGPGIGAAAYEVGPEVPAALGADGAAAHRDGRLDLAAVIRAKLERAGAVRIEHVDRCTYSEPEQFFSYRRDGARCGRQAGIAWRS